jgi:hypothetical protein
MEVLAILIRDTMATNFMWFLYRIMDVVEE